MVRKISVVLLLVVSAAAAHAQRSAESPVVEQPISTQGANPGKVVKRLVTPLGCDRVSIAEGLPNSNVRAIAQDQRGFVWLGTQDGLARYDGIKLRVYRSNEQDPRSISSGYITSLDVDAKGSIWVGTAEHGINRYDPETDQFTRFETQKAGAGSEAAEASDGVAASTRDAKGRIWFAMGEGGLKRLDPATGGFTDFLKPPVDTVITAIDDDAAGNLWLGTAADGAIRWNPETGASTNFRPTSGADPGLPSIGVTALVVASTGIVWIGTDEGLFALEPATSKFTRHVHVPGDSKTITDDHISVLFEDAAKNVWVGTSSGLSRMNPAGDIVQYQHDPADPTSLHSPGIESIFQSADGVMWIGGFTAGVCSFDELDRSFGYYRTRTHANSFFEDKDGTLWVGTYNDGLHKYERGAQRVTVYRTPGRNVDGSDRTVALDAGWIAALHRDRRGTLWIALKGHGLIAFDTKNETYTHYLPDPDDPTSLPVDTVFYIWEDPRGALWLASWGGGLVRFDPAARTFRAYLTGDSSGLSSNHLYNLYPDPLDPQVLWLGTAKGGLVRFNMASETSTVFRHDPANLKSISSDDVLSIHRGEDGIVWIGTYGGGLNRLDPATGTAERFTTANSRLTNDAVFGVLPDPDKKLWLTTNGGGLLRFDPAAKAFVAYDISDGIQDNEFSQGSFRRAVSGDLIFGGPGGFNVFNPRNIARDPHKPPIVLTMFKIANQEVKLDRPIWTIPQLTVSYDDSFELQFAALSYGAQNKNRYAYKLEGFDDDFIETDRPFATYAKLDGGKYTLRIRAANRHGVWNETGIAVKLAVSPPFWRTWAAYGIYLAILAGLALMVMRIQRQRVLRAHREGRLAVVERDLALTGAVQNGFLPDHNEFATMNLQVQGMYRPADTCSGDWWWYQPLRGGRHLVMVGDVTGHGPGPAMVTAAVATAFRVIVENVVDDVSQALELLNREVLRVAKGQYHMTLVALELQEATGQWIFYSAGGPPMISLNQAGKHRVHFCAGTPLGTAEGFEMGQTRGTLKPTERLLMYTDGIPEIEQPNGTVLGMRRFAQIYEQTREQHLRDAAATMIVHADRVLGRAEQLDDWTFAMLEWGAAAPIDTTSEPL